MIPSSFTTFFAASTGAGAALIGLLFVAVSVAPHTTVGRGAPAERYAMATSALTALVNAFFISLGALIPQVNIGWFALFVSGGSLMTTLSLAANVLKSRAGWLNLLRRGFLVAVSLVLYGFEFYFAVLVFKTPTDVSAIYSLTALLLGVYGLGMSRAWQLLGAPKGGLLGWLSPLYDLHHHAPAAPPPQESAGAHTAEAVSATAQPPAPPAQ
jgi:hypothetical protein